ncbi:MAG: hybrid sensor histidine kinase/response regulator [Candidatus Zixiibacteriota bacterium]|nr:MAG: hybrid sensor histidine kinase/response regulator [candidate division Zixibacteria bacterium]
MATLKRVLIVEDDRVIQSSLSRALKGNGCQAEAALSAREGLDKFRRAPYDLILADLRLPDMDGLDMVRRMREMDADLPFIVLTAHADPDDTLRALKLGAVDLLQKPFDLRRILALTQHSLQPCRVPPAADTPMVDPAGLFTELSMKSRKESSEIPSSLEADALLRLHELQAPYTSLGRFGNGVTHNLNGFLTGLMGHLEILQMRRPELSGDLEKILELARKIRDYVADLSTKYENETLREPQPQNLNQILRAELAFLRADLFFKHYIELRLDLQEPLANVYGQYSDFSLAFEEIILNAVDAQRDRKRGVLTIRTRARDDGVIVEFEDEGSGFSPEALLSAFDPFRPEIRTDEDGRVRGGLGLFLARMWLQRWGGEVEVENRDGGGARVRVRLPRKEKAPAP